MCYLKWVHLNEYIRFFFLFAVFEEPELLFSEGSIVRRIDTFLRKEGKEEEEAVQGISNNFQINVSIGQNTNQNIGPVIKNFHKSRCSQTELKMSL